MNELTLDDIYNETYDDILKYVVIHAKSLDDVNDLIQNIYFSLFMIYYKIYKCGGNIWKVKKEFLK